MKYAVLCASVMLSALLGINVAFAASEDSLSNEYLFTAFSKTEQVSAFASLEETNTEISDRWAYVSASEDSNIFLEESYLRWENAVGEKSSFLVMGLCVDNRGEFVPNISYVPSGESCEFIVYLIEKNTCAVDEAFISGLSEVDRLGVLRTEASCVGYKVQYFPQRSVEQGEYYLVFVSVDGDFSLKLSSFALNEKISTQEMDTFTYNVNSTVVVVDGNFKGNNTEFTKINWKNSALDLTSTDPFAIEVDEIKDHRSSSHGVVEHGIYYTLRVHLYDNTLTGRSVLPVRIKVPHAGKYMLSVNNKFDESELTTLKSMLESETGYMAYVRVLFGKAPEKYEEQQIEDNVDEFIDLGWYNSKSVGSNKIGLLEVPCAGEYYVLFIPTEESLKMNPHTNDGKCTNENVPSVDTYQWFALSGIELIPVENDSENSVQTMYEETVVVNVGNAIEYDVKINKANIRAVASGVDDSVVVDKIILPETSVNIGEEYTVVAPEIPNHSFLCWRTGLGYNSKVVSSNAEYTFTVKIGEELLTAVYQNLNNTQSTAVFYNGNGQVLESVNGQICVIPPLPSMSGFGTAECWEMYGCDEEYLPGDEVEIEGMVNFVARYGSPHMISVEATEGCAGAGKYPYGDVVTLTAPEKNGTLLFNYWTDSDGEIVSFESTFTFTAAFDCKYIAVYKEYLPNKTEIKKIQVVQNGIYTIVTFIGMETAIERGVIFGETPTFDDFELKRAMQTDATVFSIENQTGLTLRGYALFEGGKVIYSDD